MKNERKIRFIIKWPLEGKHVIAKIVHVTKMGKFKKKKTATTSTISCIGFCGGFFHDVLVVQMH